MRAVATAVLGCTAAVAAAGVGVPAAAAPARPAQAPPPVTPRQGSPFTPTQGDWEGTSQGFHASFELRFDPVSSRYALTRLVLLRPSACPADPVRHDEFFLKAPAQAPLGHFGAVRFGSAGVWAGLDGAGSATVTSDYRLGSCGGTLTWRMHPARRVSVDDGAWTIRYGNGTPARFDVDSGGRLARALPLPPVPRGCAGLRGSADAFIAASGRATLRQSGLSMAISFARRSATGTFRIPGCRGASARVSASAIG